MDSASAPTTKVVEQYRVSPPPGTVFPIVLPTTFFDALAMFMPPVKRLFFYQSIGITTKAFLTSHVPALRHSLSLALQHFFSLAGNLLSDLTFGYDDGDSVSFLVAETDVDFANCMADTPKDVKLAQPLVPQLPPAGDGGRRPLLAVQFTVFAGAGFTLGVTIHHAAADGNSMTRFLKSWAAIHYAGGDLSVALEPPIYDRGELLKYDDDKVGLLNDLQGAAAGKEKLGMIFSNKPEFGRIVRATAILSAAQINKLRHRITSANGFRPSTFVSAVSFVWACLTEARGHSDRIVHLIFAADCRTKITPAVPPAYFGNCLGTVSCKAVGSELVGQDGLIVAAKVLQAGIGSIEGRVVAAKREIVRESLKLDLSQARLLTIAGSPRFGVYEVDFGWGSPKKVEVISTEAGEAMSLAESRAGDGGVEIGIVGPTQEIERFIFLINNYLEVF